MQGELLKQKHGGLTAPSPAGWESRLLFSPPGALQLVCPTPSLKKKRLVFHDDCPLFLQAPVPLPPGSPPWFLRLRQALLLQASLLLRRQSCVIDWFMSVSPASPSTRLSPWPRGWFPHGPQDQAQCLCAKRPVVAEQNSQSPPPVNPLQA